MHFLLGFLLGYYTRNKPLLAATLTIIALLFFIVLPAIALSGLALSVRRERLSRPPQTRVPQLVGLDYQTAETTLQNSKLNIRVLAHRYDPPTEPGKILFQTPQAGESVACGTVVGIVISKEDRDNKKAPSLSRAVRLYMLQAVILPVIEVTAISLLTRQRSFMSVFAKYSFHVRLSPQKTARGKRHQRCSWKPLRLSDRA